MTLDRVRKLRRAATEAERRLWGLLRNRRLVGLRFRRQVHVGPYIADFLCTDRRLIVELDGSQHADREEADRRRTRYLEARGYFVVRFWNDQVLTKPRTIQEEILGVTGLSPSPRGEKVPRRGG